MVIDTTRSRTDEQSDDACLDGSSIPLLDKPRTESANTKQTPLKCVGPASNSENIVADTNVDLKRTREGELVCDHSNDKVNDFSNERCRKNCPNHLRAFSVVPVSDPKSSPNTNLAHEKQRVGEVSVSSDRNSPSEVSFLIENPELKSDYVALPSTNVCTANVEDKNVVNIVHTDAERNSFNKQSQSLRRLKSVHFESPAEASIARVEAPECAVAVERNTATYNLNTPTTSCNNTRKLSTESAKFRSPETKKKLSSVYHTVSAQASAPLHSPLPQHYHTVQPNRTRLSPNKTGSQIFGSTFMSLTKDGERSVDFGSTDGRNIKFSAKGVIIGVESSPTIVDATDSSSRNNNDKETSGGRDHSMVTSEDGKVMIPPAGMVLYPSDELDSNSSDPIAGGDSVATEEEGDGRATWANKQQFILACIGSCVGLGNFWRFPYLCYKSGGGAFLIPYTIMLFVCGIPLLLMEMAIGQYTRRGPIGALYHICPMLLGSAFGVVVISIIFCSYYNIIISWAIFYFIQSFIGPLPWTTCPVDGSNGTLDAVGECADASPTQYFFDAVVLQKSSGIEHFGGMVWPLFGCALIAWVFVYFAIWKSVKSSGLVVMITATVPYLFIAVFLVRAVTLEGAGDGLRYLFYPDWKLLLHAKVWVNAAAQNFNSIGIGFGAMITFSSYSKFSNNLLLDVWVIGLTNAATSLLAGIIVFSTMGNIALEQGKNITDVVAEGPGLAFVVYPQALAKMYFPNFFSILFFAMIIMLGIDSQFATVEVVVTSLQDSFPQWIKRRLKRHEILVLLVCVFCFTLGLPNLFEGGIYYFNLLDYYSAAISLMYLAFFEVIAVVWFYGANRLARNIKEMTGKMPSQYFKICWYILSPALILIIAVFSWIDYTEPTYNQGTYWYPPWAIGVGWMFASFSLLPIPVAAAVVIYRAKGDTIWRKFTAAKKTLIEECPKCQRSHHNRVNPCRCTIVYHTSPDKHITDEGQQQSNGAPAAAPPPAGGRKTSAAEAFAAEDVTAV